ncbi:hypothetical protein ONZ45_g17954 [Pleurotus djamor]|nr:hypothetical protein ONZ45_g17954 [Pleurotus djamor]
MIIFPSFPQVPPPSLYPSTIQHPHLERPPLLPSDLPSPSFLNKYTSLPTPSGYSHGWQDYLISKRVPDSIPAIVTDGRVTALRTRRTPPYLLDPSQSQDVFRVPRTRWRPADRFEAASPHLVLRLRGGMQIFVKSYAA